MRAIAVHLPQFHPIAENDAWWGKGFTEWTNVTKAKPLFKGHYQPHLPADLGFYDLRLEEARIAQAELAKEYGIHGFCYYHYWFNGKRLLERPVEEILNSGKPDFPFMFCWANENWSRRWDGSEDVLLMRQDYLPGDAEAHCRSLLPYFRDKRYIAVGGKPVFAIYRPDLIPDVENYLNAFREEARKENVELYLCAFETFKRLPAKTVEKNFEAAIEFQPHSKYLLAYIESSYQNRRSQVSWRIYRKVLRLLKQHHQVEQLDHEARYFLSYPDYVDYVLRHYAYQKEYKTFPGVTPMWDNAARRKNKAFLLHNASPEKYFEWISFHKKNFEAFSADENFLFINAWNEWAEGNHLEPCQRWGRSFLEATKAALFASQSGPGLTVPT